MPIDFVAFSMHKTTWAFEDVDLHLKSLFHFVRSNRLTFDKVEPNENVSNKCLVHNFV